MGRIEDAFAQLKREGKKGLIPFITAGDPNLDVTCELMVELANSGATIIELGVPFSDPMADGPVIQRASERALKHGFGLKAVLETAAKARKRMDVPIVLFSYFNPLLQFGLDKLGRNLKETGIDGLLVTDLIPEESGPLARELRAHEIDLIFLVAPTTTESRLRMITDRASGFIYAVSRAGVTGTRTELSAEAETLVKRVRGLSDLPVAVGFGISTAGQIAETWRYADAAVVGSAIVSKIEQLAGDADIVSNIGKLVRSLTGTYIEARQ